MTRCIVGAANVAGCVVGPASAANVAGRVVIGATTHRIHALVFLAPTARMPDAIISPMAASMAHPVVGAPVVASCVVSAPPATTALTGSAVSGRGAAAATGAVA